MKKIIFFFCVEITYPPKSMFKRQIMVKYEMTLGMWLAHTIKANWL